MNKILSYFCIEEKQEVAEVAEKKEVEVAADEKSPSIDQLAELTIQRLLNLRGKPHTPEFNPGDSFWILIGGQIVAGTVHYLRDDSYERINNHPSGNYHYSVNFETTGDKYFETYQPEYQMISKKSQTSSCS
jgi:hypothetical protein